MTQLLTRLQQRVGERAALAFWIAVPVVIELLAWFDVVEIGLWHVEDIHVDALAANPAWTAFAVVAAIVVGAWRADRNGDGD